MKRIIRHHVEDISQIFKVYTFIYGSRFTRFLGTGPACSAPKRWNHKQPANWPEILIWQWYLYHKQPAKSIWFAAEVLTSTEESGHNNLDLSPHDVVHHRRCYCCQKTKETEDHFSTKKSLKKKKKFNLCYHVHEAKIDCIEDNKKKNPTKYTSQ